MADKPVRFGMIGCGEIAVQSIAAIQASPESCQVTAVQDVVEAMAQDAGAKLRVPAFTDPAHLLARRDVDAVVISTPHFLHEPLTLQAAAAGKHVACEKPIACTVAQAGRMIDACRRAGVLLSVNYVLRYDEVTQKAAALFRQGAIGKLIRYECHSASNKPARYWSGGWTGRIQTDWRQSKEKSGGGVLLMNVIHDLDRVHHLAGLTPERVYAEVATHCTPVEVEDNISVTIRYAGGAIGSIDALSCALGAESFGNRLYGTEGQIALGRPLRVYTTRTDLPGLPANEWTTLPLTTAEWGPEPRAEYFRRLAQAIASGAKACDIPGEDGRASLAVCQAAYEAGETHAPVLLK